MVHTRLGGEVKALDVLLPVFLPGNKRDWVEVAGIAKISDQGEILITLHHKEAAEELIAMCLDDPTKPQPISVSIDYRLPSSEEAALNTKYKEPT